MKKGYFHARLSNEAKETLYRVGDGNMTNGIELLIRYADKIGIRKFRSILKAFNLI